MPTQDHGELPTIDSADLATIVGGAHAAGHTGDAQLTAALASITDSLKSLQDQRSSSGDSLSQLLPMMMLMNGGPSGGGRGGCPGGNCGR